MKRLQVSLFSIFLLSFGITLPAKANPWLVLEGVNLGFHVLKGGVEKVKDFNKERKNKKRKVSVQNKIIEIDEARFNRLTSLKKLSKNEKKSYSQMYYKAAGKKFYSKDIIEGCFMLYQVLVMDIESKSLLKKIKKKTNKYNCTKYQFISKKSIKTTKIKKDKKQEIVKKLNFPKSLLDPYNQGSSGTPKNDWLNNFNKSTSNVTIWTGIRNTYGSNWSYAWRGRYNLDTAVKDAFSGCVKRKKDRGTTFKEFHLCVPLYIKYKGNNGRDTSDEEKIKFMTEYYGKNKTINFFKNSNNLWALNDKSLVNSLQIAKAEPSQTQKAANEITYDWVAITKHPSRNKNFIATKLSTRKKAIDLAMMKCYKYVTNSLSKRGYNDCSLVNVYNEKNKDITQLAKQEQSQSLDFENYKNFKQWSILHKYDGRYFWNDSFNVNLKEAIAESAEDCVSQIKRYSSNLRVFPKDCKLNTIQIVSINNKKKIFRPTNRNELNKLISKNLALLDEKTSTKIAKKQEPEQEEFKPKKTYQDNEAPVIKIAEAITVNDTDYEFQGKVTDQAKTIYVEVDGRPTDVKNGKFTVKGYSPIDKQISIEAIDQWGNRSEPKIVKLTIDIKDTSIAEKLEPLNPSKIKSKSSNNKVALIIGIENYLESPNAKYANLDAKYFFDYARKGFGVKKQNINLLVDEQATFVKTNKALTKWLRSKIKSGQSDLIIFFAGHGLASSDGELYLLPQDSDPDLLARTALSRTELLQEIINLNPKSVTMFLDTCYSGVSRDEKMLLASARPIRIIADEQSEIPNNFTIFSASKLDQISSGLKEANHGIFSYYLMKGLEGKADSNQDKKITNGELLAYMDLNISQKASELGRQQNPSLSGDPNKVLVSYR